MAIVITKSRSNFRIVIRYNMKCICIKDVHMSVTSERVFTCGKIYEGKDVYLTNDLGDVNHDVRASSLHPFFKKHFIEIDNIDYTVVLEAELKKSLGMVGDKVSEEFISKLATRLNSFIQKNCV